MARQSTRYSPSLIASVLAHAAVIAATLVAWPWLSRPLKIGNVTPVTLVASGPPADLAPAIQAPQPQAAQAPEPDLTAPPEPAPIAPAPPTPPAPGRRAARWPPG